ncbi:hypothetical protein [Helicobacter sp. 11S03491-1]|uniref:hypothetical protein n=1 Tax=Helicobacter sp. 11S03491-1 TaxID=1476196 RepID=UPI000BA62ECE|nr:hypothetical protein [Helicobacter sp. 11S03491-1]PAF41033.1 hypothetical protein BKH45_08610 [Helicobacter sp. 11S03491-1]
MKQNVVEYLKQTQDKYPNKIAIEDKNGEISFSSFYQKALYISSNLFKFSNPPPPTHSHIKHHKLSPQKTHHLPTPNHIF